MVRSKLVLLMANVTSGASWVRGSLPKGYADESQGTMTATIVMMRTAMNQKNKKLFVNLLN